MAKLSVSIGVDSETNEGEPITFQFYSPELSLEKICWLKSGRDATSTFFAFLDSLPARNDCHYILWGHNLEFDLVSFLYDRHKLLLDESIEFSYGGWEVSIVFAHVKFARFTRGNRSVILIDTLAYFLAKLEKLAEMVCPDLPKLPMPKGLGHKRFSPKDKAFCAYAIRDSVIAYRIGKEIVQMHQELDVPLCVSAPHFASRVFRRKFLQAPIPLPPRKIVYAALSSYHGGKNNITVPAGLYRSVYALDIRSAYPFAMANFPSFTNPKLYRSLAGKGTPKALPDFGIYCITGKAENCLWPSLYSHSFKPLSGDFENVWVTGFELNEALRNKEVRLRSTHGYFYKAEKDKEPSAFAEYVNFFFRMKENPPDKIHREFYKLLLNALYGKFIQTRSIGAMADLVFDLDDNKLIEDVSIIAGGLFNPFVASLIPGHTRAYIHRLEHEYKALHTSTDGIFTQFKPAEKPGLGGLSIEAHGDLLLFRNKLYIFYGKSDKPEKDKRYSTIFPGKEIIKFALHGFHGSLESLEAMYKSGVYEYEYVKVNKLRESMRRNLSVNKFESRRSTLKQRSGKKLVPFTLPFERI